MAVAALVVVASTTPRVPECQTGPDGQERPPAWADVVAVEEPQVAPSAWRPSCRWLRGKVGSVWPPASAQRGGAGRMDYY